MTLTKGPGPFLVVDNSFGGLGHALSLDALEKGEIDLFVSHYGVPRGRVRIDADGKLVEAADPCWVAAVMRDLESKPYELDDPLQG